MSHSSTDYLIHHEHFILCLVGAVFQIESETIKRSRFDVSVEEIVCSCHKESLRYNRCKLEDSGVIRSTDKSQTAGFTIHIVWNEKFKFA